MKKSMSSYKIKDFSMPHVWRDEVMTGYIRKDMHKKIRALNKKRNS